MKKPFFISNLLNKSLPRISMTLKFSGFIVILIFSKHVYASNPILDNKVVIIKPLVHQEISGRSFSDLSLVAFKNNAFKPIPYQFDELNEDGSIYIEGEDSLALKVEGVASDLVGEPGLYDGNDELLFMLRDAGDKKTDKVKYIEGKIIAELEVIAIDNVRRYVYLVEGALLKSETGYVRYSADLGRVETDKYSLKVEEDNAVMWEEFIFNSFDGANSQKPIDTLKMTFFANVIPLALTPMILNNKNLKATTISEKTGQIRATTTYRQVINWLKVPWFACKLQIIYYESKVQYKFVIRLPEGRRQIVANVKIGISTDGRDLDGADLVFSSKPDLVNKVDGKVSDDEKVAIESELDVANKNWIWLNSHNHYASLTTFKIDQQTKVDSDFNKPKVEFRFMDDKKEKVKPEFFRGQSPEAGFVIKFPQFGKIFSDYSVNMFSEDIKLSASEVFKLVESDVTVNTIIY